MPNQAKRVATRTQRHKRSKPRYPLYGYDWQQCREEKLKAQPTCEDCEIRDLTTEANEVHHILKPIDYPQHRLNHANLMCLCKSCHSIRTKRGE